MRQVEDIKDTSSAPEVPKSQGGEVNPQEAARTDSGCGGCPAGEGALSFGPLCSREQDIGG